MRHNTAIAMVNSLNSEILNLKSSLETVNISILSTLALQENRLNTVTTATSLNLVALQLSDLQMTVNDTHGITRSELLALDEKYNIVIYNNWKKILLGQAKYIYSLASAPAWCL